MTGGAGAQHSASPVSPNPSKSPLVEAGRCRIQMCCFESSASAPMLPVVQWLGHGFGQDGSYSNAGMASTRFASCVADNNTPPSAVVATVRKAATLSKLIRLSSERRVPCRHLPVRTRPTGVMEGIVVRLRSGGALRPDFRPPGAERRTADPYTFKAF